MKGVLELMANWFAKMLALYHSSIHLIGYVSGKCQILMEAPYCIDFIWVESFKMVFNLGLVRLANQLKLGEKNLLGLASMHVVSLG